MRLSSTGDCVPSGNKNGSHTHSLHYNGSHHDHFNENYAVYQLKNIPIRRIEMAAETQKGCKKKEKIEEKNLGGKCAYLKKIGNENRRRKMKCMP